MIEEIFRNFLEIKSLNDFRAEDIDSPGKTPSLPSATTDSGTVECHSPPLSVPIFIGATLSFD